MASNGNNNGGRGPRHKQSKFHRELLRWMREWEMKFGKSDEDGLDLERVAEWAVSTGKWKRTPPTIVQACRRELSRAAAGEYYIDPQGREVRVNHPVRTAGQQGTFHWFHIQSAPPEAMQLSLATRRRGIYADVKQCKVDHDSYDDNNKFGAKLPQMDFNFNVDLSEETQPDEYPDEKPEDEDGEDEDEDGEDRE